MKENLGSHRIVINVCDSEEARFFVRFLNAGKHSGYGFTFLTYRYHVYTYLKEITKTKADVYYLNTSFIRKDSKEAYNNKALNTDLECLTGDISIQGAEKLYASTIGLLGFLASHNDIEYIWCWNGYKIVDHALTDFAQEHHIKTLYFEIANINGKLFVDPMGTNCRSYLYGHVNILNEFSPDLRNYEKWRKSYIIDKFKQMTVKQAKKRNLSGAAHNYMEDIRGYFTKGGVVLRKFPLNSLKRRFNKIHYDFRDIDFSNLDYIFFPLQVSTDTQVLINGNVGIMEAARIVLSYAQQNHFYLIIKPHPAEKNPLYFQKLQNALKSYDKVLFTNENTFELIKYAKRVFTINSTVGLETMILGQKVHVFGKALYENFKQDDLPKYIMGYLFDIDYWGEADVDDKLFKRVLDRADISTFDKSSQT